MIKTISNSYCYFFEDAAQQLGTFEVIGRTEVD